MYTQMSFCSLKFEIIFMEKSIFDNKTKLVMTSKNGQSISSRFKSLYQNTKSNPVPDGGPMRMIFPWRLFTVLGQMRGIELRMEVSHFFEGRFLMLILMKWLIFTIYFEHCFVIFL